jgi:lysophospholipase L1-like esterase
VNSRRLLVAASVAVLVLGLALCLRPVGAAASALGRFGAAAPPPSHVGPVRCRVSPNKLAGSRPLVVTIGASFTAGVGAGRPSYSWAVRLAQLLDWRSVTVGVPGAGYTDQGVDDLGPLHREVGLSGLATLDPQVVIVQAGHDDWRTSAPAEAAAVARLIRQLESAAPTATLVFLTVFARAEASVATMNEDRRTDATIVAAVRAADPLAVVLDPLADHWRFPRAAGGLHPSAAGHLLIAKRVAAALYALGVVSPPLATPAADTVTCQSLQPDLPPRVSRSHWHL